MSCTASPSSWTQVPSEASIASSESKLQPISVDNQPKYENAYIGLKIEGANRTHNPHILIANMGAKEIPSADNVSIKSHDLPDKANDSMNEVDAKIATSEARTDVKFAEFMGELRLINARMEHIEKSVNEVKGSVSGLKQTIVTTAIVTAVGVIGVVVAIFGYGTSMFATGMDAQSIADKATQSAVHSLRPDIEELQKDRNRQEQQYELILKAIQSQNSTKP